MHFPGPGHREGEPVLFAGGEDAVDLLAEDQRLGAADEIVGFDLGDTLGEESRAEREEDDDG